MVATNPQEGLRADRKFQHSTTAKVKSHGPSKVDQPGMAVHRRGGTAEGTDDHFILSTHLDSKQGKVTWLKGEDELRQIIRVRGV